MNKLNISDNITRLRRERKLTQEELADFCGVTKASVSKWEKGINTPDLLLLPQLAAYFDVTVDELIGYQAQLSKEQIRRQYAELSRDFALLPFSEALEKVRVLTHKYYACYPLLLQLGNAAPAIEALESSADPGRLAGQAGTLLAQAYRLSGDIEKARSYTQVKQYLDLLALTGDAILALSLNEQDLPRCEEIIRRVTGIAELYHLEALHPNMAAQFQFQSAAIYALHEKSGEALAALTRFEKCVERLLNGPPIQLHGDDYFDGLDVWIDRLPLEGMAPRDQSFIRHSLREALTHPAFDSLRDRDAFKRIVHRLTESR